jgi:hypothetical protein
METFLSFLFSFMQSLSFAYSWINAAEKKQKREQHHDVSQVGLGVNVNAYPGVYGAPQVRKWYRLV